MTIRLQTMSNIGQVPEELLVGRGDPVYMAHAYLTKVPVPAIVPFIEAYTKPGGVVVDPFAGSGMTGVAAAVTGRTARLFDVSVLGRHIGRNYVNFVDSHLLAKHADEVVAAVRRQLGDIYGVQCMSCNRTAPAGEDDMQPASQMPRVPALSQLLPSHEGGRMVEVGDALSALRDNGDRQRRSIGRGGGSRFDYMRMLFDPARATIQRASRCHRLHQHRLSARGDHARPADVQSPIAGAIRADYHRVVLLAS